MSRIVTREMHSPFGCGMAVMVEHTQFRRLLMQQRTLPVRYQWAGARFRSWRIAGNNEAQQIADHTAMQAWIDTQRDPKARFTVIDGGRDDESPSPIGTSSAAIESWAQEARIRWQQEDGFAKALDP